MKASIKKTVTETVPATSRLTHSVAKFATPVIWRGKSGKGVYIRLDAETRVWLDRDAARRVGSAAS